MGGRFTIPCIWEILIRLIDFSGDRQPSKTFTTLKFLYSEFASLVFCETHGIFSIHMAPNMHATLLFQILVERGHVADQEVNAV